MICTQTADYLSKHGPSVQYPGGAVFRNPRVTYASSVTPESFADLLWWCQEVYFSTPAYRQAYENIVAYFITDLDVGSVGGADKTLGQDEKEKWLTFVNDQLDVPSIDLERGINKGCFGNSFCYIVVPFERLLTCACQGLTLPLRTVATRSEFNFQFSLPDFIASCPRCGRRGKWRVDDKYDLRPEKLSVRFVSPHEMMINEDLGSRRTEYFWRIPEDYKRDVKSGNTLVLENVEMPVIEAIHQNAHYRFYDDVIFHDKEPTLAGIRNRGWGIPRMLLCHRAIWYMQVLQMQVEAIAMNDIVPLKLISPGVSVAASDSMLQRVPMRQTAGFLQKLVREHRVNPTSLGFVPFPVELQQLGYDSNKMAPKDMLQHGYEMLQDSIGGPLEIYRGSIQVQSAPLGVRMFESRMRHHPAANNAFLRWLVRRVSSLLKWEPAVIRHQRVTVIDDINKQAMLTQLFLSGEISRTQLGKMYQYDWRTQQRERFEEDRFLAEQAEQASEEQEQMGLGKSVQMGQYGTQPPGGAAMGGPAAGAPAGAQPPQSPQAPQGGDPAAGAAGTDTITQLAATGSWPQTPEEQWQVADIIANELLANPVTRQSRLHTLREQNRTLHGAVKAKLEEKRNQMRSEGSAMLQSQMAGA